MAIKSALLRSAHATTDDALDTIQGVIVLIDTALDQTARLEQHTEAQVVAELRAAKKRLAEATAKLEEVQGRLLMVDEAIH